MLPCRVILGFLLAVVPSWTLTSPAEALPQAFVSVGGDDGDPNYPGNIEPINPKPNCGPLAPCRTFARALEVVDEGGEVVALSSGDYDRFTVRKRVSVVAAPGVHAVIGVPSGNGINVAVGGGGLVTLRGLTLHGLGGATGINVVAVDVLHVEDCVLNGFTGNAITFGVAIGQLHLRDTTVTNSGSDFASAVFITGGFVSINRLRMDHNRHGVVVDGGTVTIRDSVSEWQTEEAVWARGLSGAVDLTIENCTFMGPGTGARGGITAGDPAGSRGVRMSVSNSTVMNYPAGILADQAPGTNTKVWVSNTTITLSNVAVVPLNGASILSRGNNTLKGNNTDGDFSWGFSAK